MPTDNDTRAPASASPTQQEVEDSKYDIAQADAIADDLDQLTKVLGPLATRSDAQDLKPLTSSGAKFLAYVWHRTRNETDCVRRQYFADTERERLFVWVRAELTLAPASRTMAARNLYLADRLDVTIEQADALRKSSGWPS